MQPIRNRAMSWWNTPISDANREILARIYYRGRNHTSLTGREIENIWINECKEATKCDTFLINEKVSFKKENESAFHLTVLNNRGVIIKGLLHIPCGNEKGFIEDYPVIHLSPSNIEKAKKWWKKRTIPQQLNMVDIEMLGEPNLLMGCDIEMLWDKYNNGGDVTKKTTYTYEDMMACYTVGVSDGMESVATNERVNTVKDWLNEKYG